ncbi:DUF916 domain-containing protein [Microbacterium album]|uniref:DUF916 domain-containing protein n=1 Tax=Microbacterium album TaxID=2053191 RepID=A0A917IIZ5_9MICO|nr:DUF916 domain-containing protein [Microbacterium album]GGH51384.1 hypothetical protein GCM10010921_30750 [Microbacterium album]
MTPRTRLRAAALVLLASLLVPVSAAAAAGAAPDGAAWSVQTGDDNGEGRANFSYAAQPGDVISDTMIVRNTGTIELPLEVYAADAFTTPTGNIDILPAGTPSTGAGAWVSPDVDHLALQPGQEASVAFTIAVPEGARPGDHSAAIVTSLTTQDAEQPLEVDRRLGTRITVRVAGELVPDAAATIVSVDAVPTLNPLEPVVVRVVYRVENTGNTRIAGTEALAVHTVAGLLRATSDAEPLPEILPGSTVELVREVPAISLGWVGGDVALAVEGVGLGAGALAPVSLEFSAVAVPWSLLAVLLIACAIAAGVLLWIRRRRTEVALEDGAATADKDSLPS